MDERALEFTRRGDELFNGLARRFPHGKRRRLSFEHPIEPVRYAGIQRAAAAYISTCLGSPRRLSEPELLSALLGGRGTMPNYTPGGVLEPKAEHTLEWNLLHRSVADAFAELPFGDHVDTIDLPVNLRIVYGSPNSRREKQPFSSSKVHSDVWAGVPVDAAIVVMPLFGDIDDITIEFGEMPCERELAAMRTFDDYLEGREFKMVARYDDVVLQQGKLYVSDVRLLHHTVRKRREGVRVSLDFRFRYRNAERYRALAPVVHGAENMDGCVPYGEWLRVGTGSLMVFDETIAEAKAKPQEGKSSPVAPQAYHIVDLTSPVRRSAP